MSARRITVTGLVQGVFYRAHAQAKAQELGLKGWIKNNENGNVEVHAEGPEGALEAFEHWCWEGPDAAEVTSVQSEEAKEENLPSFQILR